jgi:hypothetical protein
LADASVDVLGVAGDVGGVELKPEAATVFSSMEKNEPGSSPLRSVAPVKVSRITLVLLSRKLLHGVTQLVMT